MSAIIVVVVIVAVVVYSIRWNNIHEMRTLCCGNSSEFPNTLKYVYSLFHAHNVFEFDSIEFIHIDVIHHNLVRIRIMNKPWERTIWWLFFAIVLVLLWMYIVVCLNFFGSIIQLFGYGCVGLQWKLIQMTKSMAWSDNKRIRLNHRVKMWISLQCRLLKPTFNPLNG